MLYVVYPDELYHHGIRGQKWHKRNGPPYPLDESDHSASEKKAGWKKSLSAGGEAKKKSNYRKQREAIASANYQKSYGVSKEKADKLAEEDVEKLKSIAKKAAIGVGVAAAIGVGLYAYDKIGREYLDDTIKAGTTIQHLSAEKDGIDKGLKFYESHRFLDKQRYRADSFAMDEPIVNMKDHTVKNQYKYNNEATANRDVKIASIKKSEKIYEDLKKSDKSFAKAVGDTKYSDFNTNTLIGHDNTSQFLQKKFYNAARKQGYGGIADVNDRTHERGSIIRTKANIVFDKDAFDKKSNPERIKASQVGRAKAITYIYANIEANFQDPVNMALGATYVAGAYAAHKVSKHYKERDKQLRSESEKDKKK